MATKLTFGEVGKGIRQAIKDNFERPMKVAATNAMTETAAVIKARGRGQMREKYPNSKFPNAWRSDAFPSKGQISLTPAIEADLKSNYGKMLDEGGEIDGSPFLWLPFSTAPRGKNGRRFAKPKDARKALKMFMIKRGKVPLLAANLYADPGTSPRLLSQYLKQARPTVSNVKKQFKPSKKNLAKHIFKRITIAFYFAVSRVLHHKQLDLQAMTEEEAGKIYGRYYDNLKD